MIRLLVTFLIIILSIKSSQFQQADLCEELSELMKNDQQYRKQLGLQKDTFIRVFDSLKEVKNISQDEYSNLTSAEQSIILSKSREIASKQSNHSQQEKDSLWQLQSEIDHYNTRRLIEIIKNKGWITKQNLGCQEEIKPWIIFRHAPKKYFAQIREIIDKENSISNYEYKVIDNHLKGRPSMFNSKE